MKRYIVTFEPNALEDIDNVQRWISEGSSARVAEAFVKRLLKFCDRLDVFPLRGAVREDVRRGLRTVTFEKAVSVAYRVDGQRVAIMRIVYRGRNLADLFGED